MILDVKQVPAARAGCGGSVSVDDPRRMSRLTRVSTRSAGVDAGSALRGGHVPLGEWPPRQARSWSDE